MKEVYHAPPQDIPIDGDYDVVIVGGGCAGLAASIAAARNGARTLVMERFPYFGGTATASLMTNIVGTRNQVRPNDLQVCKGIGEELILGLLHENGACETRHAYIPEGEAYDGAKGSLAYSYAFDSEIFKKVSLQMVRESGCHILFHVFFSDVILEGDTMRGVIYESKAGRRAITAKVVVDATGDGDVCARAGVPFWQTRHEEHKRLNDTLMYKIKGFDKNHITIPSCVFGDMMTVWGPDPGGHNALDPAELTAMEIATRTDVYNHFEKLQKEYPELKHARIAETGPLLGIRQTRFIEGEYQLTGEDVLSGARFDDVIALASNPVINYYGYRRYLGHEGYDIPYRCIVPKHIDGLLAAGRCMSSDQVAFESWRAMAHILCIGEAAGTAAALSALQGVPPRMLCVKTLQDTLRAQNAELGQNRTVS